MCFKMILIRGFCVSKWSLSSVFQNEPYPVFQNDPGPILGTTISFDERHHHFWLPVNRNLIAETTMLVVLCFSIFSCSCPILSPCLAMLSLFLVLASFHIRSRYIVFYGTFFSHIPVSISCALYISGKHYWSSIHTCSFPLVGRLFQTAKT